jgi:hypothetical protein
MPDHTDPFAHSDHVCVITFAAFIASILTLGALL